MLTGPRRHLRGVAAGLVLFLGLWSSRGGLQGVGLDFTSAIWAPGRAVLENLNPYRLGSTQSLGPTVAEMPLYGPSHILLSIPFGALPLRAVGYAWQGLCLGALVGFAYWTAAQAVTRNRVVLTATLLGGILISRAGQSLFVLGEPSIIYIPLFWLVLLRYRRDDWLTAALLMALTGKPTFALPLVIFLLVDRRWRLLARAGLLTAAVTLPVLALLVAADGSLSSALEGVMENARFFAKLDFDARVDIATMVNRVFDVHHLAINIGVALAVLVPLALVARQARAKGADDRTLALLMALGSVVAMTHANYDVWMALLVPAAGALATVDRRWVAAAITPSVALVVLHAPWPVLSRITFPTFCTALGIAIVGAILILSWRLLTYGGSAQLSGRTAPAT